MKLETKYEIKTSSIDPNRAQLEIITTINGEMSGSFVCLSGNKTDIEDYVRGEINLAEIRRMWGFKP